MALCRTSGQLDRVSRSPAGCHQVAAVLILANDTPATRSSARNTNETVFDFDETIFRLLVLNSSYELATNGQRVAERQEQ